MQNNIEAWLVAGMEEKGSSRPPGCDDACLKLDCLEHRFHDGGLLPPEILGARVTGRVGNIQ